jgi:hypothetical protein
MKGVIGEVESDKKIVLKRSGKSGKNDKRLVVQTQRV